MKSEERIYLLASVAHVCTEHMTFERTAVVFEESCLEAVAISASESHVVSMSLGKGVPSSAGKRAKRRLSPVDFWGLALLLTLPYP
ncbi:hypothetical protein ROHU_035015 [Labeo rohita]|uniref:Uncharacterized protein n=1 Tax=Labeo rohita TaxID=84645 RepID=A0A498L2K2_LABRO|nr:hypothetical protein ROHU_035015 [Labeo rohita]